MSNELAFQQTLIKAYNTKFLPITVLETFLENGGDINTIVLTPDGKRVSVLWYYLHCHCNSMDTFLSNINYFATKDLLFIGDNQTKRSTRSSTQKLTIQSDDTEINYLYMFLTSVISLRKIYNKPPSLPIDESKYLKYFNNVVETFEVLRNYFNKDSVSIYEDYTTADNVLLLINNHNCRGITKVSRSDFYESIGNLDIKLKNVFNKTHLYFFNSVLLNEACFSNYYVYEVDPKVKVSKDHVFYYATLKNLEMKSMLGGKCTLNPDLAVKESSTSQPSTFFGFGAPSYSFGATPAFTFGGTGN